MAGSSILYTPSGYHRAWRAQIAAKYSGKEIEVRNYVPGVTDKDSSFLSKFPPATVPVLECEDGTCLFDANAIAFYLGTDQLRGGQLEYLTTQWVNYADNIVMPAVATWVYPALSVCHPNKQALEKAKTTVVSVMKHLNPHLSKATYLVGERLSQADITMFTALYLLFTYVYDESSRRPYPHVLRWYHTIAHQPEVVRVVGDIKLCEKELHFDAKKYGSMHSDSDKPKDAKSPKTKKEKEKEPPKPKEEVHGDGDEEEEKPEPSKNVLASLPAGTFNMDEFKRIYSNEDIENSAIPYFWRTFDPETHSLWYCEYNYPEELRLTFMSCNLIGGMFQRLEKMVKYAFGSVCIFGEDYKSTISGLWFWRGTGLVFDLDPDLQIDYSSYTWRKLDPNSDETKELVRQYFTHKFPDKPFNQGKIFK